MVILHERELTWAGRVSWKHHTCMISALSISTTLKQHPLIWSAVVSFELYKAYLAINKTSQRNIVGLTEVLSRENGEVDFKLGFSFL